jgi:uncharacterized membrane protein YjjP (DUF1212 family)
LDVIWISYLAFILCAGDFMDLIMKIFVLGLIGAIATIVLNKSGKNDIALIVDIALIIVGLSMIYGKIQDLINNVSTMFGGGF